MSNKLSPGQAPIVIAGGRGFVGTALIKALVKLGKPCLVVSRDDVASYQGVPCIPYAKLDTVKAAAGVINLAGANIAERRWTASRKSLLVSSRLDPTRRLSLWAKNLDRPPEFMINASAIGFYGDTGDVAVSESTAAGADFAADLCQRWEAALQVPPDTRRVIFRLGVVLGEGGGALEKMLPAFRLGLGGKLGCGQQWMSWIAMSDVIELLLRAVDEPWEGVFNATSPNPLRNCEFTACLGRVVNRPTRFVLPAWLLQLLFGEMSSVLLGSQKVLPDRLLNAGFAFQAKEIEAALALALRG